MCKYQCCAILYKGLEHPWISVFLVGPGTSPLYMDAKGWLYLSVLFFFFFYPCPPKNQFLPLGGGMISPRLRIYDLVSGSVLT